MKISNLQATIERQKFEILDMSDRCTKNEENIENSLTSIADLESQLSEI